MSYTRCYICDSKGARSHKGQAPTCTDCQAVIYDTLYEMSEPWEVVHRDRLRYEQRTTEVSLAKEKRKETSDDDPDTEHRD